MNHELFRKKNLDKIKSPENLDDYIKVSNPGIWLILVCVFVLLIGACIWGVFGHIDSIVPVTVRVENGNAVCYVEEENIVGVAVDMTVTFEGDEAVIEKIGAKDAGGYICPLKGKSSLSDGFYKGNIVVKSYKPISFILN